MRKRQPWPGLALHEVPLVTTYLPAYSLATLENRMTKPYQPLSNSGYPLTAAADDLAAFLRRLDEHGWEIDRSEDDPGAWCLVPKGSMGQPNQRAVVRRADGRWHVSEWSQSIPVREAEPTPWERLRELADQLEREAAS